MTEPKSYSFNLAKIFFETAQPDNLKIWKALPFLAPCFWAFRSFAQFGPAPRCRTTFFPPGDA